MMLHVIIRNKRSPSVEQLNPAQRKEKIFGCENVFEEIMKVAIRYTSSDNEGFECSWQHVGWSLDSSRVYTLDEASE